MLVMWGEGGNHCPFGFGVLDSSVTQSVLEKGEVNAEKALGLATRMDQWILIWLRKLNKDWEGGGLNEGME